MSATNVQETAVLGYLFNATAMGLPASYEVSLHATWPGEAGDQSTGEVVYGAYERRPLTRSDDTAFLVSGDTVSLIATLSFPKCTSGTATAMFFGIGDAHTGAGVLRYYGVIGDVLGPFSGAVSDAITIPGLSGVVVDDRICFGGFPGSSLPSGITEGVAYWVKTVSGDAVTVSATQGGAAIDLTGAGSGVAFKITPLTIGINTTPQLEAGSPIVVVG